MNSNINDVAKGFVKALNENQNKGTSPYDTTAEIRNIKDGTAWVHIPGGVDETPVDLTINAKIGDIVQVRVSGGRAWITGNATNPPTDDTRANVAYSASTQASEIASMAASAADDAYLSAIRAENEAEKAGDAAKRADENATTAYNSAMASITHLSTVEDIVGTLEWISQHGVYQISKDTDIIQGKLYFTVTGTAVTNPTGNPNKKGYYELINGFYTLTTDTEVNSSKTYYEITARSINPTQKPENLYYELASVDSTVENYISTHLALDDKGLSLTTGVGGYIRIESDGVYVYGSNGLLAKYSANAIIGDPNLYHIEIQPDRLSFYNGTIPVAYMSSNQLYIERSVVVDSMQVGAGDSAWIWKIDAANNMGLYYVGTV